MNSLATAAATAAAEYAESIANAAAMAPQQPLTYAQLLVTWQYLVKYTSSVSTTGERIVHMNEQEIRSELARRANIDKMFVLREIPGLSTQTARFGTIHDQRLLSTLLAWRGMAITLPSNGRTIVYEELTVDELSALRTPPTPTATIAARDAIRVDSGYGSPPDDGL